MQRRPTAYPSSSVQAGLWLSTGPEMLTLVLHITVDIDICKQTTEPNAAASTVVKQPQLQGSALLWFAVNASEAYCVSQQQQCLGRTSDRLKVS